MFGLTSRTALLGIVVSPLVALGAAVPTAAPAAAAEIEAECTGVAPVQRTCTATGTFGPTGTVYIQSGVNYGYTGDLTITVTTATMNYSWTVTFAAGVVTKDPGHVQTGGWQAGQSFTLTASAPGTGYYDAYVYQE